MTVFFEDEGDVKLPVKCESVAKKVISAAAAAVGCPYDIEVNLLLTTDENIRVLNKSYRGMDKATDVLSFPMTEYESPADFEGIYDEPDAFDPESGELLLGDIVISKDRVMAQAAEYGHSVTREYAFLITHGMLHLFGYDHVTEDDRLTMETLQESILRDLRFTRC